MRIKATAVGRADLRDRCGHLDLRPDGDDEAELLSRLYRLMMSGGQIQIRQRGTDPFISEFPSPMKESA